MKHKLHIKELFGKLLKKKVVMRDPQLMHPEREWGIGLVVSALLFVGAASVSAYTYFSNQNITVGIKDDVGTEVVYRESIVKEVIATIEQREKTLSALNRETTVVAEIEEIEDVATSTDIDLNAVSATSSEVTNIDQTP